MSEWISASKAKPSNEYSLVYIYEVWYHGVTVGYWTGNGWESFAGSDDIYVTYWMPMEYPEGPE